MKTLFLPIGIYLLVVNLWGFIQMLIDKKKAERNYWRMSEFSLFIPALLGGALGCLLGMRLFHHKTHKLKFVIGMPLILVIHVAAVLALLFFSPFNFSFM
ncbi:MAG: DUF1294 domain-containing protein [Lachnospiraceae bacterium]|nr:DUF1294 domain-containing protein [Lachnospiraceae bacterium]